MWQGCGFSGESRENRYLASLVPPASLLPRAGPVSGRQRPARCEGEPAITGTGSHRPGYRDVGAAAPDASAGAEVPAGFGGGLSRQALEQAIISKAVELLSGPGGLASFLRRRQLGARAG